jgi:Zn-finger nucleic acid-binding protein
MWLENKKVPDFMETVSASESERAGKNLNDAETGICPLGHGIMIRAKVDIDEPFYLEKCSSCGGIWFDNGEWEKIIHSNFPKNLNELWCKSWQVKQRKEKSRKSYLDINRKLLGDNLFEELMKLSEILKDHPEKGRAIALLQQEVK